MNSGCRYLFYAQLFFATVTHSFAAGIPTTTSVLISPPTQISFGARLTLTATVSPSDATGKVTFYDGAVVLGIATLSQGTASYSTTLPAGNRKLKAFYSGDPIYNASTSDTALEAVFAASGNILAARPIAPEFNQLPQDCLVVADFNGDGKADFALASRLSGLTILLGNGDGSFQQPIRYPALFSNLLAVGDFDGDGTPDLVLAGVEGLNILLGNGNGTFKPPVNYPLQAPGAPAIGSFTFALGDFNRDGQLDVVVVSGNPADPFQGSGKISVLLGNGDGTLQSVKSYPFSIPRSPYFAAVGDFNGDGNLDLIGGSGNDGNLCVRLGNGDGTFQDGLCFAGGSPTSIAVYDLNGDGKDDLVLGSQGPNTVSVLSANGDGTFTATTQSLDFYPSSLGVGDFNGDGIIDLAIVSQHGGADLGGSITLLYGNSDGTFQTPVNYAPTGGATYPSFVVVADFNGDGTADLATISNLGSYTAVSVWLGILATIAATSGTPQSASTGQPFGAPLQCTVQDAAGDPVRGATVMFTPPATDATASLNNSRVGVPVRVLTNDSGIATVFAAANNNSGSYVVTASVALLSATFSLTNGLSVP